MSLPPRCVQIKGTLVSSNVSNNSCFPAAAALAESQLYQCQHADTWEEPKDVARGSTNFRTPPKTRAVFWPPHASDFLMIHSMRGTVSPILGPKMATTSRGGLENVSRISESLATKFSKHPAHENKPFKGLQRMHRPCPSFPAPRGAPGLGVCRISHHSVFANDVPKSGL